MITTSPLIMMSPRSLERCYQTTGAIQRQIQDKVLPTQMEDKVIPPVLTVIRICCLRFLQKSRILMSLKTMMSQFRFLTSPNWLKINIKTQFDDHFQALWFHDDLNKRIFVFELKRKKIVSRSFFEQILFIAASKFQIELITWWTNWRKKICFLGYARTIHLINL